VPSPLPESSQAFSKDNNEEDRISEQVEPSDVVESDRLLFKA
jgi:hypothetical protein